MYWAADSLLGVVVLALLPLYLINWNYWRFPTLAWCICTSILQWLAPRRQTYRCREHGAGKHSPGLRWVKAGTCPGTWTDLTPGGSVGVHTGWGRGRWSEGRRTGSVPFRHDGWPLVLMCWGRPDQGHVDSCRGELSSGSHRVCKSCLVFFPATSGGATVNVCRPRLAEGGLSVRRRRRRRR